MSQTEHVKTIGTLPNDYQNLFIQNITSQEEKGSHITV